MKKLFLSLVAVIVAATTIHAQDVYVATLNHEGTITEYYGATAFQNAYNAAVDGDCITLSAGTFTGTEIKKALTIRGTGMIDDTANGVSATVISGLYFTLTGKTEKMYVEGIKFTHAVARSSNIDNAVFCKCSIDNEYGTYKNCTLVNCYLYRMRPTNSSENIVLNNCFLYYPYVYGGGGDVYNATCFNCYIHTVSNTNSEFYSCNFTNCIISYNRLLKESNKTEYCVSIYPGCKAFYNLPENPTCVYGNTSMFKSWEDASSTTNLTAESFELSDEGKVYLSVDGTEVGMLGGNYPYNPIVSIPRITKCEVAEKATADGKLSVNIEVTAPTE